MMEASSMEIILGVRCLKLFDNVEVMSKNIPMPCTTGKPVGTFVG
jgi:hypothetical protein